jgi:hypothetical protein
MNKHMKNKSKGQSLGNNKFYKVIKWYKFSGHNHITKSVIFLNTWYVYRIINLFEIIIMLFIKYVL